MHVGLFFEGLILIGSVGFLIVVYYAFRLSEETKNEKYWLSMALAALFLAVHQWSMIPWELHIITEDTRFIIEQISAIAGSVLFAYSIYGLFSSMKRIRQKTV